MAWLSNSALSIARLLCCRRFLLLRSMGQSRKGRNPAHAGSLHVSPRKVQQGTLDLLLLCAPSRRARTFPCAYGHPNARVGAGWTKGRACSEVIGTIVEELLEGPPWLGVTGVLAAGHGAAQGSDRRRQGADVSPQPSTRTGRRASLRLPQPFFFLFSLYIICCRNYSYLQMNDLVPLLAWLRFHPSRRKLPANPAALAQTRALSMRSWQQRVTPEPTAPGAATCQESFLSSP